MKMSFYFLLLFVHLKFKYCEFILGDIFPVSRFLYVQGNHGNPVSSFIIISQTSTFHLTMFL
jgi:hypothetical protein